VALYNEIQIGRVNRFLQKYFGIKGGPPSPQLQADVGVAFPLFNGVENRYLEGWQRFAVNHSQVAVAANAGTVQFRNPVGSNMIAVFEKLMGTNTGGATDFPAISLLSSNADLATVFTPSNIRLDNRHNINPTMILSRASPGPAVVQTILLATLAVNANYDFIVQDDQEIPLLPGDVLRYNSGIVNQRIDCSAIWRERFLEEGERF